MRTYPTPTGCCRTPRSRLLCGELEFNWVRCASHFASFRALSMPRQMGSAFIRGETSDENGALRILFFAEEVHQPRAESILSPLLQSNFINSASPRVFCAGCEFYAQAFSPSSTQADLLAEIKQLTQSIMSASLPMDTPTAGRAGRWRWVCEWFCVFFISSLFRDCDGRPPHVPYSLPVHLPSFHLSRRALQTRPVEVARCLECDGLCGMRFHCSP
ncbi:hypothetical protein C8J57DRAFT_280713 [Mycena rebaudengoi]|nr:hypothetical protein C8J57DRAFT_280713 [Mycena rebaudengoi]